MFEINFKKIKYVESNNINGYKQKIKTNEISNIIFRNGDELRYNKPPGKCRSDTTIKIVVREQYNVKPIRKIGDYIKLNIMASTLINNSDNNRPHERDTAGTHGISQYKYHNANNQKKVGFDIGFNFLFGSSPYIKHVFGLSYLFSNGEFNYSKHSVNSDSTDYNYKSSTQTLNIKSTDYYLNIVNGIRLRLFKSLYLETCVTINIPTTHRSNVNGTTLIRESGNSDSYYYTKDSIGTKSHVKPYYALNPRIIYEFQNKNGHKFGVQAACNLNANYKAFWLTLEFTYYPFKKLR